MSEEASNNLKRSQFGNRHLVDAHRVFDHNAWDDVEWTEELESQAKKKVIQNSTCHLSEDMFQKYENDASEYWDSFYNTHQDRFFKDRHWLFTEFPDLATTTCLPTENGEVECGKDSAVRTKILEVGCGVGNTLIPLLEVNNNPNVFLYGCDFSNVAINILKEHPKYASSSCHAFVCDVTDEECSMPFPKGSLDIIILIFIMSALNPSKFKSVTDILVSYLKPGGLVLFRDYGRFDLAQLRFKKGSCLGENFYVRGDGTRSYFFAEEEVDKLFSDAGLQKEMLHVDRRLQVNRGKQLKMYRIWIQAKYRKPA